ncbi:hypothetical protein [Pseudomonas yangonensis]|uniref:hypothetical protein n=1 Tax=Pseudomonas yangonensis TaxID=2579922 RepID=UPI00137AA142|nr:hypothetical protein [Pseudomonas yangonensis]
MSRNCYKAESNPCELAVTLPVVRNNHVQLALTVAPVTAKGGQQPDLSVIKASAEANGARRTASGLPMAAPLHVERLQRNAKKEAVSQGK